MSRSITDIDRYLDGAENLYKKVIKRYSTFTHKKALYNAALIFSIIFLLLSTAYAGLRASRAYSTDSNAIVSAQLFDKTAKTPIVVPGPHSNLLVDPLFYLQGHLPYHYTSFTIGNVSLVLITMIAWAILLIKLFGRKYEIPILLLLSSLILTSIIFSLSLGYTAIRNIQYPIALAFVMIISSVLRAKRKFTRKQFWLALIGSLLFSITLAGDSFFIYGLFVPLILIIIWYWAQSTRFTRNMVKAVLILLAVFVGAELMKAILQVTNILDFNYAFWGQNTIIPTRSLAPSFTIALQQLLNLQGGNIFGQVIHLNNLSTFVNFGLFLAGFISIIMILIQANKRYRLRLGIADGNNFVFTAVAVSYFITFWIYVLSGYVITTLPNGQIISVENTRYISFMPLLGTVGIIWLIKYYFNEARALVALLCAVLILSTVVGYSSVTKTYRSGIQLELAPSRDSINQILYDLRQNHVNKVLADYWYAPDITFWSNNQFSLVAQPTCSPSTKQAQFTHKKDTHSALIVDRGGLNYAFWNCTDQHLEQIYGAPAKKLEVPGVTSNPVQIWIYN